MAEPSLNQFTSDGKLYTFVVSFIGHNVDGTQFSPITLDNAQIMSFKYDNELNSFCLKGELICADSLGRIDKILDKMYVQCQVVFIQMEEKFDGAFTLPKYSDKIFFKHVFLVENVAILERQPNLIKYKITLTSINILKCNANISFSNYNFENQDKTLLNTLKSSISQAQLTIDSESFDNIDTDIIAPFITNGNDTVQSIAKYILNRMFYVSKDNSLKFIRYNETTDQYTLYDIKDKNQALGMTSIMISLLNNTSREGMTTEIPANLGTVTRFPQSKTIKSFFTHDFRDYDYNQNVFFDRTISADELIHYINQSPPIDNIDVKFTQFIDKSTLDFKVRGGYWNNDFSMYDNMVNILAKDNALVVNTGGYILRRPGDYVSISIDRNTNQLTSEKRAELQDILTRYAGLEGLWTIYRSSHIIQPAQSRYTQNLVLMRNFTVKPTK